MGAATCGGGRRSALGVGPDQPAMGITSCASYVATVASAVAICAIIGGFFIELQPRLDEIRTAEDASEAADQAWERGMAGEDAVALHEALHSYEHALELASLGASAPSSNVATFAQWLVRPLRLRCMRRIAAGRELLQAESEHAQIVEAHAALLREDYCGAVEGETGVFLSEWHPEFAYASCLAPHARGTILFAPTESEAEANFERAIALTTPQGAPALTWTTRWQLPDRHTPGLAASAWWAEHPAVRSLEDAYPKLLDEFDALRRQPTEGGGRGGGFSRRRSDAWIAQPREGWSMRPLWSAREGASAGEAGRCIAPVACALVRELRGPPLVDARRSARERALADGLDAGLEADADGLGAEGLQAAELDGAGYYLLAPGTRLHPHAGPTNERLTCHLTLRGEGASFQVGSGPAREWQPGRAFCFDDSFVHQAVHRGSTDRYVLLVDVPHPDFEQVAASGGRPGAAAS